MKKKVCVSKGSYVIIKPISNEKETYKGKVMIANIFKTIKEDDILIYLLNDVKKVSIEGKEYLKGKKLEFTGLDARF